jgi:hypothetical protein
VRPRDALTLTLRAIASGPLLGAPLIHTDNDMRNAAMLAINSWASSGGPRA